MLLVIESIYGVLIVYQAIYFVLYRNDLISLSPTLRKVLFDQLQKRRDGLREVKHSLMTVKRGAGLGAGCLWLRRSAPAQRDWTCRQSLSLSFNTVSSA